MGHRQRRVSWTAAKEVVQSQQLRVGSLSPEVLTRRSLQLKPENSKHKSGDKKTKSLDVMMLPKLWSQNKSDKALEVQNIQLKPDILF